MKTFEINGVTKTLHEWHIELWNWLADNPTKEKGDWFNLKYNGLYKNEVHCECFACQLANYESFSWDNCKKCPIKWGNEVTGQIDMYCLSDINESSIDTLFDKWILEKDLQQRSEYARQIANLPWDEQEETDVQ